MVGWMAAQLTPTPLDLWTPSDSQTCAWQLQLEITSAVPGQKLNQTFGQTPLESNTLKHTLIWHSQLVSVLSSLRNGIKHFNKFIKFMRLDAPASRSSCHSSCHLSSPSTINHFWVFVIVNLCHG